MRQNVDALLLECVALVLFLRHNHSHVRLREEIDESLRRVLLRRAHDSLA